MVELWYENEKKDFKFIRDEEEVTFGFDNGVRSNREYTLKYMYAANGSGAERNQMELRSITIKTPCKLIYN